MATTETTAHHDADVRKGWRWPAAAVVAVVSAVAGWALLAPHLGFAWPYPQRLPDQISFRGFDYRSEHSCLSRQAALSPYGDPRRMKLVAFGSVPSAVVVGGPQMLAALADGAHDLKPGAGGVPMMIYVPGAGSCFVPYAIVQGPL